MNIEPPGGKGLQLITSSKKTDLQRLEVCASIGTCIDE